MKFASIPREAGGLSRCDDVPSAGRLDQRLLRVAEGSRLAARPAGRGAGCQDRADARAQPRALSCWIRLVLRDCVRLTPSYFEQPSSLGSSRHR